VCIDRDGIGSLYTHKHSTQFVGSDERAALSRIHVIPETGGAGDLGSVDKRIDHPRIGRASGAYHHYGNPAKRTIGSDHAAQRARVHTSGSVGIHEPDGEAAYPRLVRDFEPSKVALSRDIKDGRTVKGTCSFRRKV
jgi:hypothetical protein